MSRVFHYSISHTSLIPVLASRIVFCMHRTLFTLDWPYRSLTSSPSYYLTSSHLVALSKSVTGYHLPQQY